MNANPASFKERWAARPRTFAELYRLQKSAAGTDQDGDGVSTAGSTASGSGVSGTPKASSSGGGSLSGGSGAATTVGAGLAVGGAVGAGAGLRSGIKTARFNAGAAKTYAAMHRQMFANARADAGIKAGSIGVAPHAPDHAHAVAGATYTQARNAGHSHGVAMNAARAAHDRVLQNFIGQHQAYAAKELHGHNSAIRGDLSRVRARNSRIISSRTRGGGIKGALFGGIAAAGAYGISRLFGSGGSAR